MRYRAHINVAALALIGASLLAMFDQRLNTMGLGVILVTFLAWVWLRGRIRPTMANYLEHLRRSAEDAGHLEWLETVEAEFMKLWQIKRIEEVAEP